jgi:hypothetical protein
MAPVFLIPLAGTWSGPGLNHESQPYTGRLTITPINPTATILTFTATGTDGTIYHAETILIGETTSTSASNNLPGLATFTVAHPTEDTLTLTLGDLTDDTTFRETITLQHAPDGTLHQSYSWSLPGSPIQTRSITRLTRT